MEVPSGGKIEETHSCSYCKICFSDVDNAFHRIRSLERQANQFLDQGKPDDTSSNSDFDKRLARVEQANADLGSKIVDHDIRVSRIDSKISEVGQNGAEKRETLSTRVTEVQATILRVENRFDNLDSRTTKIVQGNEILMAKLQRQYSDLDEKLEKLERLESSLLRQKKNLNLAIEMIFDKTTDPSVVPSFSEVQEKKKKVEQLRHDLHEDRLTDDNV